MVLGGSSSVRLFPESCIYWKGCLRLGGRKHHTLKVFFFKKKEKRKKKTRNKTTETIRQEKITVKSNYYESIHRSTLDCYLLQDSRKY